MEVYPTSTPISRGKSKATVESLATNEGYEPLWACRDIDLLASLEIW
jgi:hypothetical protein